MLRVVEVAVAEQRPLQVLHEPVAEQRVHDPVVLAVEEIGGDPQQRVAVVGHRVDVPVDGDPDEGVDPADLAAALEQQPVGDDG